MSQPVFPPKLSDPTDICMCLNMRSANKAILLTRHITPTLKEIMSDLNGAVKFSKLDLNQGYHQLLLDEDSGYITTFTTHIGLWRYKHLNFGICCVSEIFQNKSQAHEEGPRAAVGKAPRGLFNLLKQSLREDTVTQYYDPKKTTEIIVDASPVGLGAILV